MKNSFRHLDMSNFAAMRLEDEEAMGQDPWSKESTSEGW